MQPFDLNTYLKMEKELLTTGWLDPKHPPEDPSKDQKKIKFYDPNDPRENPYLIKNYIPLITSKGHPVRILCVDRLTGKSDPPVFPNISEGLSIVALIRRPPMSQGKYPYEEIVKYNSSGNASLESDKLYFTSIYLKHRVIYKDSITNKPAYKDFDTEEAALDFCFDPNLDALHPFKIILTDFDLVP